MTVKLSFITTSQTLLRFPCGFLYIASWHQYYSITNRNSPGPTTYYYSKENYMKMIFVAINGITCATGDKWAAQFEFIRQDQSIAVIWVKDLFSNYNDRSDHIWMQSKFADGPWQCKNTDKSNKLIQITSPNYPLNYPNNMRCEYRLGAATNRHVNLHFVEIKMDRDDFIRVYDGPDDSYPLLTQPYDTP